MYRLLERLDIVMHAHKAVVMCTSSTSVLKDLLLLSLPLLPLISVFNICELERKKWLIYFSVPSFLERLSIFYV